MRHTIRSFIRTVTDYYHVHGRSMPWRSDTSPYGIFVSEIMLQQTQVGRVLGKYAEFLSHFPNFQSLSKAKRTHVLLLWQGMGYNRRAKYLHESARIICSTYQGVLPREPQILETLPGIGPATAGSISCFAYNTSPIFIETNIRRCVLHYFFPRGHKVPDTKVREVLRQCMTVITREKMLSPRQWYWALMDYGSHLKDIVSNPNKRSKQYVLQSKFEGSDRQIRGRLLREYLQGHEAQLATAREHRIWKDLVKEGLVNTDSHI